MAKYTTRVELHRAQDEAYRTLHEAMTDEGFTLFVEDSKGKKYELPPAEYNYESDEKIGDILKAARRAATKTGLKFSILVTEMKNRRWYNLEPFV